MKDYSNKLSHQLLSIVGFAFVILFLSLGLVLPNMIIPLTEKNLYNYLSEPLKYVNKDDSPDLLSTEVAYIYVADDNIYTSSNYDNIVKSKANRKLLKYINEEYGKFTIINRTYYYYTIRIDNTLKIAITDDSYINRTRANILGVIFPIIIGTVLIIGLILVVWSSVLVRKIEKLKAKIDNIDNENFDHKISFKNDDEIKSLEYAIEDMRISLISQEKLRNEMYQNISHDFKTPLSVIKSYIEAVDDDVEDYREALKVIKEQTNKLEFKVKQLLYLNKLDYLNSEHKNKLELVDMKSIINQEVEKFKFVRQDIKFVVSIDDKSKYYGTVDNWETVLDNLLTNFERYAKSTIKISTKSNKIILYNDGDNIEDSLLDGIFTPFRKGIKGEFGLGLSIVKKTLNLMGYDIIIKNEKIGVSFIITKSK